MLATGRSSLELPAYRQIAAGIADSIRAGALAPGERLPSETDLAARHGVSRGTIRQTLGLLQLDGLISSRQGARRMVLNPPRLQSFSELMSFSVWAHARGEEPGARVVDLVRRAADAVEAERLDVAAGAVVYVMTRVRTLSGAPVMIERTTYPEWVGWVVVTLDGERESITQRLEEAGVSFAVAEHTIDALPCGTVDSRLLGVQPRTPLLRERRRTTSPDGRPVEWSDDRYRADAVAFTVRNTVANPNVTLLPGPVRAANRMRGPQAPSPQRSLP
jgi:GntR family transcriptional regulator